ncbi:MAG: hemerythrin domain-containing protein [Candidatus Methylomirabilia bacterium]
MTSTPPTGAPHHHHGATTATAMLREEHEVILRALELLERLGRDLETGRAVDRNAREWLVDFFRTFADRCHHGKEEALLFPALERHGVPKEGGPVGVMLLEHEEGRALVRAIGEGDDAGVAAAIRKYVTLLRAHIEKENGVLFPMAEQVLPDEEQRLLVHAFEEAERTAVGPGVHERFLAGLARLEREAR